MSVLQTSIFLEVLNVEILKNEAESGKDTVVVGTDSELLVLIAAYTQPQDTVCNLVVGNANIIRRNYCFRKLNDGVGNMKIYLKDLPTIHRKIGCDTT